MKFLYKDRFDKKLGGVCGGLAQYFQIDATIIRILFIFLIVFSFGCFFFIYLILWWILPMGPKVYVEATYKKLYRSKHRKIAGICGGFGHYFHCDANIIRLICLIACIFTGFLPMIVAYLVAMAIIPETTPPS